MDFWTLYRQCGVVAYRPQLARLYGTTPAILLSQLLYWFTPDESGRPRVKTIVDAELWLAWTAPEWEDATALTKRQVRLSLQGLEAHQALRTRKALIPRKGWLTCVQPNLPGLFSALSGYDEVSHSSEHNVPPGVPESYGGCDIVSPPIRKDLLETLGKTETMSAREALKAIEGKQQEPRRLEHLWASLLAESTGRMSTVATRKQLAMFKRLQGQWGDQSPKVVRSLFGDWGGFCLQVMSERGLTRAPDQPTLEFLVRHADVALAFAQPPQVLNSSSPAVRPTVLDVPTIDETAATPEEVEQLMRDFGDF